MFLGSDKTKLVYSSNENIAVIRLDCWVRNYFHVNILRSQEFAQIIIENMEVSL